ncbi:MAG: cupin domain-containing protein [Oscillospiraceae bacterium]|nr:cupin domain-containing protein [Oscillospiraceae bacterium]
MIKLLKDIAPTYEENAMGGPGKIRFDKPFTMEQLGGRFCNLTRVTMRPGDGVGQHAHTENAEVYYMLEGEATIIDDGVESVLRAGDAQFCADGHTHGIYNHTDKDASFLAIIVKNV